MAHDVELLAAYLAGELAGAERDAVERHLLTCDTCWADIEQARRGRELVQRAYEPAPAALRTRLRDIAQAGAGSEHSQPARQHRRRPRRRELAAALAVAAILAVAAVAIGSARPTQADPVAAAVTGYTDQRLPGDEAPAGGSPSLSLLGLTLTAASSGQLAGQHVDAYANRDAAGRRVVLYLSDQPFAMPPAAQQLGGQGGARTIRQDHIVVLCARTPHEVLIIGTDIDLVHDVAVTLDLT